MYEHQFVYRPIPCDREERENQVDLTKRQQEIFDFIGKYADRMGYPPTVREIGKAVGLHSSSTVHVHLSNLEKAGVLRRDPTKPRALEILVETARSARDAVESAIPGGGGGLPLLGRVSAGPGMLAEENVEDYVEVPELIGGRDGDFVLEVRGESMKDAGIVDRDWVVVRPQQVAEDGEIVVALLGEDATVKRIYREEDHIRLQPENAEMEPIRTTDAELVGRVIGVIRKV